MLDNGWEGKERREGQVEPIHPWRWRILAVWIVVFTIVVILQANDNRARITDLNRTKADVVSLERTNCGLRQFLHSAYKSRLRSAAGERGIQRANDLKSAQGYAQLLREFPIDNCPNIVK